jgi:3',5'-cyclic AMP phosphodiesterase CpdA
MAPRQVRAAYGTDVLIDPAVRQCSAWVHLSQMVSQGSSVLVLAPRYYGAARIAAELEAVMRDDSTRKVLFVKLGNDPEASTEEHLGALLKKMLAAVGKSGQAKPRTAAEFERAAGGLAGNGKKRLTVVLGCAGIGPTKALHILRAFDSILLQTPGSRLNVVAIDDFTILTEAVAQGRSFLEMIRVLYWPPLSAKEVQKVVRCAVPKNLPARQVTSIAATVFQCTDGHPSLLREMLQSLQKSWSRLEPAAIRARMDESSVLREIESGLNTPAPNIASIMRRFSGADGAPDVSDDPYVKELKSLGLLVRVKPGRLRVAGGALGLMLARRSTEHPQGRSRQVSSSGRQKAPAVRIGDLDVDQDDLVIVQLSDLHFGGKHAFLMRKGGRVWNEERPSFVDALLKDLDGLGLSDRVDALLLTGDFVETGESAEFELAADFVRTLSASISVSADRILMIPGNHDVTWNPSEFNRSHPDEVASLKNFEQFRSELRSDSPSEVQLLDLASPTSKRRLLVFGLNSNYVEGPDASGVGWVSNASIEAAHALYRQHVPPGSAQPVVWIVVHHHLVPVIGTSVFDARRRRISLLANGADILEFAQEVGASCVIHGHQHQPGITELRRWSGGRSQREGSLLVIAAGSAGVHGDELGPIAHNHYYVYVLSRRTLTVLSRRTGDTGKRFVEHGVFRAELANLAGRPDRGTPRKR